MLYVVGPLGMGCTRKLLEGPLLEREDFLSCVERLGSRCVSALRDYNGICEADALAQLPKVEELRWCLVSGGVYRHPDVSKLEVAAATISGMKQAPALGCLRVVFSYDEDVFRLAFVDQQLQWREYDKIEGVGTNKVVSKIQGLASSGVLPEWVATEKVHGANFCFITDGSTIEWAKRTSRLSSEDKFFNSKDQMPRYHPMVLRAFGVLKAWGELAGLEMIRIYGEYFGGWYPGMSSGNLCRIQPGVAYAPDHHFIPFDVWVGSTRNSKEHYLDFDDARAVLAEAGFPLLPEVVRRGSFNDVFSIDVESLRTAIPRQLGLPPVSVGQVAEGVVIRPTKEPWGLHAGSRSRLMLKKKAEAFWEAVKQPVPKMPAKRKGGRDTEESAVPEELGPLVDIIGSYLTLNRLSAVVSKEGLQLLEENQRPKLNGLLAKDVCESISTDYEEDVKALTPALLRDWKRAVFVRASAFLLESTGKLHAQLQQ